MKKLLIATLSLFLLIVILVKLLSYSVNSTGQYPVVESDVLHLSSIIKLYYIKTNHYPSNEDGLNALLRFTNKKSEEDALILKVPTDPWGRPYRYQYPAERSNDPFDIFSLGSDGIKSQDDKGNW